MEKGDRFAKIPEAFVTDRRITLRDWKVYAALRLFSFNNGHCHPKRETISALTGLPVTRISAYTARLEQLGWLRKHGDGGRSRPICYQIFDTPQALKTVTESVTVSNRETVTESVTLPVTESVTVSGLNGDQNSNPQGRDKELEEEERLQSSSSSDDFFQAMLEAFHEELPNALRVRCLTANRKASIDWACQAFSDLGYDIDRWRELFQYIEAETPFLAGRIAGKDGTTFTLTLDWLMKPDNLAKSIEGGFEPRTRPARPTKPPQPQISKEQEQTAFEAQMKRLGATKQPDGTWRI